MSRSVLTIATTRPAFFGMAVNLARSFYFWNRSSDVSFHLVTDLEVPLPSDLAQVSVRRIERGSLGAGFSPKLHLDRLAPSEQMMFVDADCLCLGPLDAAFEAFRGRPVAVVGGTIWGGEWFGDIAAICRRFSVPSLLKFNGGVYYVEPGEKATAVFDRARSLEPRYDEIGLTRLRGRPNDELLIAIAMAVEGCSPMPDDGSVFGDLLTTSDVVTIDVLSGRCLLRNSSLPLPEGRDWCALPAVTPRIVHFLGHHVEGWRYQSEALKLLLAWRFGVPVTIARLLGAAYALPRRLSERLKGWLRPALHRYVGVRKLRAGIR